MCVLDSHCLDGWICQAGSCVVQNASVASLAIDVSDTQIVCSCTVPLVLRAELPLLWLSGMDHRNAHVNPTQTRSPRHIH